LHEKLYKQGKRKLPKRKRGKASEKIMAARFGRYVNSDE
jgi:hypothetical protein